MNAIANIRTRLDVTQAAMGKALGVSQANVSNYERGQTMPPEVAAKLIDWAGREFGVQVSFDDIYRKDMEAKLLPAPPVDPQSRLDEIP